MNNQNIKIPVVMAINNDFSIAATTCMYSILMNTNTYIEFFILTNDISDKNKNKILTSLRKFQNFNINFIDMDSYKEVNNLFKSKWDISAYYRYFIPVIVTEYDKIVYTDADVIFNCDIKEYYNIDICNYGIAAVCEELGKEHIGKYNHERRKQLFGITPKHKYFANGNYILNREYWLKNDITQKCIDIHKNFHNKLICPDLDVMNIIFQDNYKKLDYKYCCCVHRFEDIENSIEMKEAFSNPCIIHYSGLFKPWNTLFVKFSWEYIKVLINTKYNFKLVQLILELIFSIKKYKNHINFTIFGIKLKFKSKEKLEKFLINKIFKNFKNNTVLMIEANNFHGEIIPGYISYLLKLGYNVSVLTTNKHEVDLPLLYLKDDRVNIYYTNHKTIKYILHKNKLMNNFAGLFINSLHLIPDKNHDFVSFYDYFKWESKNFKKFIINVVHNCDLVDEKFIKNNKCIALAENTKKMTIVNPHYFGDIKLLNKRNNLVKFLISGDGQKEFSEIINSVNLLVNNGINNFKIYITGRKDKLLGIDEKCSSYIQFMGYLNFPELFNLVNEIDYIIPALNPDDEIHEYYIKKGTSGAFQLSYGFLKPCIIAEKFAIKALFNETNAIIYKTNKDLTEALINAILLSNEKYEYLRNNLKFTAENLYQSSLENLEKEIYAPL